MGFKSWRQSLYSLSGDWRRPFFNYSIKTIDKGAIRRGCRWQPIYGLRGSKEFSKWKSRIDGVGPSSTKTWGSSLPNNSSRLTHLIIRIIQVSFSVASFSAEYKLMKVRGCQHAACPLKRKSRVKNGRKQMISSFSLTFHFSFAATVG